MLAWWLCGVWAITGAIAYGSLVSRLPMSGGEYLFLSRFVHPSVGFLAGWISVVAGFTAPIAVTAHAAAIFGAAEVGDLNQRLIAAALIVVAAACYLLGVTLGARVQNTAVALKLILLLGIVAFAFTTRFEWQGGVALANREMHWWPESGEAWTVLLGSMSWVALSYTGFNAAVYVAGEAKNAERTVPLAMIVATCLVTVLYLLLNYIFVYAVDPALIANQERVASIVGREIGGVGFENVIRVTITLAMVTSVFSMLLAGPRVYQKMAEDGVMPRVFESAGGPPRLATVVQAGLSIAAVFLTDLLQLMKYLGLTLSACGALAVLSLWWMRKYLPNASPLRWWETLALTVYLAITFAILYASRTTHAPEFSAMLWTFAVGCVLYGIWEVLRRQRNRDTTEKST
jgi:APA family basic amino acid/polyamine antiporter